MKRERAPKCPLEAYKGIDFPAHVFRISPVVDETSRTKQMYLLFDTSDERINAGMYVKIHLNTILHENVIVIPTDSIVTESGKKYVYIKNADNTVSKREITVGASVDGKAEITSGLSEGDQIVVSGMQVLSDGVKVKEVGSSTPLASKTSSNGGAV